MPRSDTSPRPSLILGAVLAFTSSPPTAGQDVEEELAATWRQTLAEVHAHLATGDYGRAERTTLELVGDIAGLTGTGEGADYTLGVANAFLAIAESGLGKTDDALWTWHTALNLYPPFADTDLGVYGEPATVLMETSLRRAGTPEPSGDGAADAEPVHRVTARYPQLMEMRGKEGQVEVEVLVGTNGEPLAPVVLEAADAPAMTYAALQALRQWRFRPATRNGEPTEALYRTTIEFSLD